MRVRECVRVNARARECARVCVEVRVNPDSRCPFWSVHLGHTCCGAEGANRGHTWIYVDLRVFGFNIYIYIYMDFN